MSGGGFSDPAGIKEGWIAFARKRCLDRRHHPPARPPDTDSRRALRSRPSRRYRKRGQAVGEAVSFPYKRLSWSRLGRCSRPTISGSGSTRGLACCFARPRENKATKWPHRHLDYLERMSHVARFFVRSHSRGANDNTRGACATLCNRATCTSSRNRDSPSLAAG